MEWEEIKNITAICFNVNFFELYEYCIDNLIYYP